ncbi:sugar transferase [Bacillus aquiflavi]|uniref:sugar transferase n=1 Tax=Bacillus aquiflavi TaxID=2672567 RepID=UPI001FE911F2|nr:sugar transferase [Bacillus aquiflavi]
MNDILKRIFDITASFIGLVILSPVLILVSVLIKIDSKGPVFFKQTRVGRHEKPFEILKFRTMIVDAEKYGKQITVGKDKRITRVGHFLRKYKIDEFPQLFNVLVGDMSLVGPRPEVPKYTAYYNEKQRQIFEIRPGITDYASIKYRNENEILANSTDPEKVYIEEIMRDKLKINLEYVARRSLKEDIHIIFKTITKIIE